jgi:hypothetical protein
LSSVISKSLNNLIQGIDKKWKNVLRLYRRKSKVVRKWKIKDLH